MSDVTRFNADFEPMRRYCQSFAKMFLLFSTSLVALRWMLAGTIRLNWDTFIVFAVGPVGGLLLYLLLRAISPSRPIGVSPSGVAAFGPFGASRSARWDEIESVEGFMLFGVPFLMLRRVGRRAAIPLPLWLTDTPRLLILVEEYAGDLHPLTQALRAAT